MLRMLAHLTTCTCALYQQQPGRWRRLAAVSSPTLYHTHSSASPTMRSTHFLPRSSQRDEAAAMALGLAGRAGSATAGSGRRRSELASTFKSLGGAFKGMAKDVASVSKSQLKSLVSGKSLLVGDAADLLCTSWVIAKAGLRNFGFGKTLGRRVGQ